MVQFTKPFRKYPAKRSDCTKNLLKDDAHYFKIKCKNTFHITFTGMPNLEIKP